MFAHVSVEHDLGEGGGRHGMQGGGWIGSGRERRLGESEEKKRPRVGQPLLDFPHLLFLRLVSPNLDLPPFPSPLSSSTTRQQTRQLQSFLPQPTRLDRPLLPHRFARVDSSSSAVRFCRFKTSSQSQHNLRPDRIFLFPFTLATFPSTRALQPSLPYSFAHPVLLARSVSTDYSGSSGLLSEYTLGTFWLSIYQP